MTINFRMFLYLVTSFMRVTVKLLCRLHTVSKIHVLIYPYLISEGLDNGFVSSPFLEGCYGGYHFYSNLFPSGHYLI